MIPSVVAAVGRDGALEGAFFLSVMMVLYASWRLGSLTRATLIAVAGALAPWLVASQLVPESGIAWYPWAIAHVFTFLLGRALHQQRALIRQLEAARQALAGQAVAEERRRIARELHDLAGHTLAAMVLHVTGARQVLRRDPDEAEVALRDAEAVGRSSLDQIRAAVAALRTDERGTDPVLAGSGDIDELVEAYRRAGLDVTADIAADVARMDGPLSVALHRIAREALANVARHAPGNRVDLRARAADGHVRLSVVDRRSPAARFDAVRSSCGMSSARSPSGRSTGPASSAVPSTANHSQPERNTTVTWGRSRMSATLRADPRETNPTTGSRVTGWSSTPAFTTEARGEPSARIVMATARPLSRAPSSRARSSGLAALTSASGSAGAPCRR